MALSSYATDCHDSFNQQRKEPFLNSLSLNSRLSSIRRSSYVSNSSRRSDCLTSSITDAVTVEPRSKFTLYKINVHSDDKRWVVYRRYSDFVLLNKKLQKEFPNLAFKLPPKRWFRDNFDQTFIHKRQKDCKTFYVTYFPYSSCVKVLPRNSFFVWITHLVQMKTWKPVRFIARVWRQVVMSSSNLSINKNYKL